MNIIAKNLYMFARLNAVSGNSFLYVNANFVKNCCQDYDKQYVNIALGNVSVSKRPHSLMSWKRLRILLCVNGINTVGCRYNAVQYNMALHTSLQLPRKNINQNVNPQTHPILRPNWRAMRFRLEGFSRKLTALYRHRTVFWIDNDSSRTSVSPPCMSTNPLSFIVVFIKALLQWC